MTNSNGTIGTPVWILVCALAVAGVFEASAASPSHWPRFRGQNADGVAGDDPRLPEVWSRTSNVAWSTEVPGLGWSSPVVWGERVFLTSVESEEAGARPQPGLYLGEGVRDPAKGTHHWRVYCYDLKTGVSRWSREAHVGSPVVPRHPKSTYAAETATTDGERLYVLFGDLGLYCYDLEGQPLWSALIEPKETLYDYGAAASPVVHGDQVIVVYDNLEASWIAAYDTKTGRERWKRPRDETHSWATPLVWENELRTEIVVPGHNRNRGYSMSGEVLWSFQGNMSNLVIPSPFAAHGLCYIASGYVGDAHRPTFAMRPGASGDWTPGEEQAFTDHPQIAWHRGKSAPYNTSQIVYGDHLYTLYDRGFLTCHDAKTGEEVYGKERFLPMASFTASPWAYNGYLFCLSEKGTTYVVKAGPQFELAARNDLDELCLATPAIADGTLLIRTASKLYALSGGERAGDVADTQPPPTLDIWTAAREGRHGDLVTALETGTPIDERDPQGHSALTTAVLYSRTATAQLLLDRGSDIALATTDGNTALHIAAFVARPDLVDLLLEHGASVTTRNGRGQTPLDIVTADWSPELTGFYGMVGNLLEIEFDLERIQRARPTIAQRLQSLDGSKSTPPAAHGDRKPWSQFRGPNGSGVAEGCAPPVEITAERPAWKTPVPPGGSSPVVWGDRLFLTGEEDGRLVTLAVDAATGRELWRQAAPEVPLQQVHLAHNAASSTPCLDADRVYVYFGSFGLLCYDHEGRELWKKPIPTPKSMYGISTSPVLFDGKLILLLDDDRNLPDSELSRSELWALDPATGEPVWTTPRPYSRGAWSTPMVWRHEFNDDLVVLGNGRVYGYDPETGEERWFVGGFAREPIAVPVAGENQLFVSASKQGGGGDDRMDPEPFWVAVLQFDRDGDQRVGRDEITEHFTVPIRPDLPLGHPGFGVPLPDDPDKRLERQQGLFGWRDKNKDGYWSKDEFTADMILGRGQPLLAAIRPGGRGDVSESHVTWSLRRGIPEIPSPVHYDGRLYLVRDSGLFSCVNADTGAVLYQERLADRGHYTASPVVAGGLLYVVANRGGLSVLKPGDTFEIVFQTELKARIDATPAFDRNTLYIRSGEALLAFR